MVATVKPSEIFRIGRRLKTIQGEVYGAKIEFFILDIGGQICVMAQKTGEQHYMEEDMINDLKKISALLDKALCWIDSGSVEANAILEARNIADALIEGAKNTEQLAQITDINGQNFLAYFRLLNLGGRK